MKENHKHPRWKKKKEKKTSLQNTLAELTKTKDVIMKMTVVKYFLFFLLQSDAYVYAAQGVQQLRRYKCLEKKKENVTLDVQYV